MRDHVFGVASTFNINCPESVVTHGHSDNTHPLIPKRIDGYVFQNNTLRNVLRYLNAPYRRGLWIRGHYGTGKTSLIYQVCSALNIPVSSHTGHIRMEFQELLGLWRLTGPGKMEFVYGPLANAARDGHVFVLNEVDRVDPGQLVGLNEILEGGNLTIPDHHGEVIKLHPNFRFIVTANSGGNGDQSGFYQGVNIMSGDFKNRFEFLDVAYPPAEVEETILGQSFPDVPEDVRTRMVRTANEVRKLFMGSEDDQSAGSDPAPALTMTISTRSLLAWAELTRDFRSAPNCIAYGLYHAITAAAEPAECIAIEQIAKGVFGDIWGDDRQ